MNWISQLLAVSALNIRTIRQRMGSSLVALVGIAGVVVLALVIVGYMATRTKTGTDSGTTSA